MVISVYVLKTFGISRNDCHLIIRLGYVCALWYYVPPSLSIKDALVFTSYNLQKYDVILISFNFGDW